jgi:hypothetical protein
MAKTRKTSMNSKSKSKSKSKSMMNSISSGTKRVKGAWSEFVKKIYTREKKNGKTFGQCMKIASKEWPKQKKTKSSKK